MFPLFTVVLPLNEDTLSFSLTWSETIIFESQCSPWNLLLKKTDSAGRTITRNEAIISKRVRMKNFRSKIYLTLRPVYLKARAFQSQAHRAGFFLSRKTWPGHHPDFEHGMSTMKEIPARWGWGICSCITCAKWFSCEEKVLFVWCYSYLSNSCVFFSGYTFH